MPGVYAIVNIANGKKYVGQSVSPKRRLYRHFHNLRHDAHPSMHLQAAFNKYGEASFRRVILEECAPEELEEREEFWIDHFGAEYNKRPACASSNLGLKASPEWRQNISDALRKACASLNARERLAATCRIGWEKNREGRIANLKAAWDDDKKAEFGKLVAAREGLHEQLAEARATRWEDPEQHIRASETAKRLHAEGRLGVGKKHTEADIRALVEAQGWEAREIQGTQMKDRVLVYCPVHDHEQFQTVRKIVHNQRGCRECGWDRVRKAA
jgi:group I intron endonuclease